MGIIISSALLPSFILHCTTPTVGSRTTKPDNISLAQVLCMCDRKLGTLSLISDWDIKTNKTYLSAAEVAKCTLHILATSMVPSRYLCSKCPLNCISTNPHSPFRLVFSSSGLLDSMNSSWIKQQSQPLGGVDLQAKYCKKTAP